MHSHTHIRIHILSLTHALSLTVSWEAESFLRSPFGFAELCLFSKLDQVHAYKRLLSYVTAGSCYF